MFIYAKNTLNFNNMTLMNDIDNVENIFSPLLNQCSVYYTRSFSDLVCQMCSITSMKNRLSMAIKPHFVDDSLLKNAISGKRKLVRCIRVALIQVLELHHDDCNCIIDLEFLKEETNIPDINMELLVISLSHYLLDKYYGENNLNKQVHVFIESFIKHALRVVQFTSCSGTMFAHKVEVHSAIKMQEHDLYTANDKLLDDNHKENVFYHSLYYALATAIKFDLEYDLNLNQSSGKIASFYHDLSTHPNPKSVIKKTSSSLIELYGGMKELQKDMSSFVKAIGKKKNVIERFYNREAFDLDLVKKINDQYTITDQSVILKYRYSDQLNLKTKNAAKVYKINSDSFYIKRVEGSDFVRTLALANGTLGKKLAKMIEPFRLLRYNAISYIYP